MRSPKFLRRRGLRARPRFRTAGGCRSSNPPSVRTTSLRLPVVLAASLLVAPFVVAASQTGAESATHPVVGLHDSIDVASLEFAGATAVSTDDLKRIVFTRASTCRLPFH